MEEVDPAVQQTPRVLAGLWRAHEMTNNTPPQSLVRGLAVAISLQRIRALARRQAALALRARRGAPALREPSTR